MDFRATVTVAEHGRDPKNAERFLRGFLIAHPEVGAVVDQNLETGHMSATFSFEASDLMEATHLLPRIFCESADASGLTPTEYIETNVALIEHELNEDRELVPAGA